MHWNLGAWSQHVHRLDRVLSHPGAVWAVAFSPDQHPAGHCLPPIARFASGKQRPAGNGESRPRGRATVRAIAFHPEGEWLLTGCEDGLARLWQVATGRPVGEPLLHCPVTEPARAWPWGTGIRSVAFSPDGRALVTGGYDGKAQSLGDEPREKKRVPPCPPVAVLSLPWRLVRMRRPS